MNTTHKDDRTDQEKETHTVLIGGTDRCLSGWGGTKGGNSYAFWACKPEDRAKVYNWVESRTDIIRLRVVDTDYRANSSTCAHCHIYTVTDGHPALN